MRAAVCMHGVKLHGAAQHDRGMGGAGWRWGWGLGGGGPGSHDQHPCGHNSHCCTTGVLLFMLLS